MSLATKGIAPALAWGDQCLHVYLFDIDISPPQNTSNVTDTRGGYYYSRQQQYPPTGPRDFDDSAENNAFRRDL